MKYLKNKINENKIKTNIKTLKDLVYHKGFYLNKIIYENNTLIGECNKVTIILRENKNLIFLSNH